VNAGTIIRDLLLKNDQLFLPGLGTFVVRQKPAEINQQSLTPPRREFRFDVNLQSGSRLLIETAALKLNLADEEAASEISGYVAALASELEESGACLIEGVGMLVKRAGGTVKFKPDESFLKSSGAFALPVFELKSLKQTPPVKPLENKPLADRNTIRKTRPPRRPRYAFVAAGAALVIILLLVAGYFTGRIKLPVDLGRTFYRNAGTAGSAREIVFGNRPPDQDTLTDTIAKQLDERTDQKTVLMYEEPEPADLQSEVPEPVDPPSHSQASFVPGYHIIAGSFLVPNNADRQMEKLRSKGLQPVLLPPKSNYYMVSLGSYPSAAEAAKAARHLRGELALELWVMKR